MAKTPRTPTPLSLGFGHYIQGLRKTRALTQEQLAELAGLSPDTIRRIEHGAFSPSLNTLAQLTAGLRIDLTTLFAGYEHGDGGAELEILAMARTLAMVERVQALRMLAFLIALLGAVTSEGGRG